MTEYGNEEELKENIDYKSSSISAQYKFDEAEDIYPQYLTIKTDLDSKTYNIPYGYFAYGYKNKLKGEEIPRTARIISVADSFDTMNSKRVYRGPLPKDEIIRQLRNNAGIQFDPEIVPHMIKMLEDGTVELLC
mgnify:CR=1 FL=1